MKKLLIISGIAILIIGVVVLIVNRNPGNPITQETVANYISDHKDRLIPIDPVLGGTWYITGVDYNASTKSGTFSYEDGHIDGSAAFEISKKGRDWAVVLSDYLTLWGAENVELKRSPNGAIKNLGISVRGVVSDNRCPVEVNCIVAGEAKFKVHFSPMKDGETIILSSDGTPVTTGTYKVSIANVRPPARAGTTIAPDEYQITFKVE